MLDLSYIRELKKEIKENLDRGVWTVIEETNVSIMAEWLYLLDERVTKLEEEKELKFLKKRKK